MDKISYSLVIFWGESIIWRFCQKNVIYVDFNDLIFTLPNLQLFRTPEQADIFHAATTSFHVICTHFLLGLSVFHYRRLIIKLFLWNLWKCINLGSQNYWFCSQPAPQTAEWEACKRWRNMDGTDLKKSFWKKTIWNTHWLKKMNFNFK